MTPAEQLESVEAPAPIVAEQGEEEIDLEPFRTTNSTGYRGVYSASNRKYQSQIRVRGQLISIGFFWTAEEAARTYAREYLKLHGAPPALSVADQCRQAVDPSEEEIDLEPFRSERSSTGYRGVSWIGSSRRYKASISVNGHSMHLGFFDIAEEAARVYARVYLREHGGAAANGGKNHPKKKKPVHNKLWAALSTVTKRAAASTEDGDDDATEDEEEEEASSSSRPAKRRRKTTPTRHDSAGMEIQGGEEQSLAQRRKEELVGALALSQSPVVGADSAGMEIQGGEEPSLSQRRKEELVGALQLLSVPIDLS